MMLRCRATIAALRQKVHCLLYAVLKSSILFLILFMFRLNYSLQLAVCNGEYSLLSWAIEPVTSEGATVGGRACLKNGFTHNLYSLTSSQLPTSSR